MIATRGANKLVRRISILPAFPLSHNTSEVHAYCPGRTVNLACASQPSQKIRPAGTFAKLGWNRTGGEIMQVVKAVRAYLSGPATPG